MKILMVCLGNICRSPLAHGILQHLAQEKALSWEVDSAGTGNWHVGEKPDKRSIEVAQKYGIDISSQRCRQFSIDDFDYFDHILVMDHSNLKDIDALARHLEDRQKVSLILKEGIVPDPYYDDSQFDPVFRMIKKRCEEIIDEFASLS